MTDQLGGKFPRTLVSLTLLNMKLIITRQYSVILMALQSTNMKFINFYYGLRRSSSINSMQILSKGSHTQSHGIALPSYEICPHPIYWIWVPILHGTDRIVTLVPSSTTGINVLFPLFLKVTQKTKTCVDDFQFLLWTMCFWYITNHLSP